MTTFTLMPNAKVLVTKTGGKPGVDVNLMVKQAASHPATHERLLTDFEKIHARALRAKIKRHVENFIYSLKAMLTEGSPTQGQGYRFTDVQGRSYSVATGWPALTKEYQQRKLPQYRDVFWRGGRRKYSKPLLQSYNAVYYSSGRSVKVSTKSSIDAGYGVKMFGNGARMRISTEITVDRLGDELLEQILRESFFGGKAMRGRWYAGAPSKWDLTKLVWVEGRRPFVVDMAVRLGKLLQYELATYSGD